MENLTLIILVLIVCTSNILSFYLGTKSKKNEEVNIKGPIKRYQEHKELKANNEEYEKEQKILETNLENIENYNGTSLGQKDFE